MTAKTTFLHRAAPGTDPVADVAASIGADWVRCDPPRHGRPYHPGKWWVGIDESNMRRATASEARRLNIANGGHSGRHVTPAAQ